MNSIRVEIVQERIRNMEPGESLLLYYRVGLTSNLMSRLSRLSENTPKEKKQTFTCMHCGQPVWQSDSKSRRINSCECLTAIFSPPYTILSPEQWTQWGSQPALYDRPTQVLHVQHEDDRADNLIPPPLDFSDHPAINQDHANKRCWCAFCEQADQEVAVVYGWYSSGSKLHCPFILPEGNGEKLICIYNLCEFCATAMEYRAESFHSRMTDRIQLNLLRKYPTLQSKVPSSTLPLLELQIGYDLFTSKMKPNFISRDAKFFKPNCYYTAKPFAFNAKRLNGRTKGVSVGRATKANRRHRGKNGR